MGVPYCNPVHDGYFADPFVMQAPQSGSRYVAIGTGSVQDDRVFEVLLSDDLVSWRSVGGALERPQDCGSDFWAPEVTEHDGRWWMYYSCGQGDVGHCLRVAVADSPLGPWTGHGDGAIMGTVPGHVIGPGHNSVVAGPTGTDVIVYHAWDVEQTARRLCVDPLGWTDDGPVVDGPSWEPTDLDRTAG